MNIFVFYDKRKKLIAQKVRGIWNPELYHGWGKEKRFFEGWYYKIVSKDEKSAFAFIPGVAMDEIGNKQAFIQILDGKNSTSEYIKFPFESFKANPNKHVIEIEKNSINVYFYGEIEEPDRQNNKLRFSPGYGIVMNMDDEIIGKG